MSRVQTLQNSTGKSCSKDGEEEYNLAQLQYKFACTSRKLMLLSTIVGDGSALIGSFKLAPPVIQR